MKTKLRLVGGLTAGLILLGVILSFAAPGLVAYAAVIPALGVFVSSGAAGTFAAFKMRLVRVIRR